MKIKVLIGGLLLVIMSLSIGCNQKKKEAKIDKEKIKAEIQAIEDRFALTYNNRNADSITYYADDAISYFAGQMPILGKAAIHQHINDELMDLPEGAKISFRTLEIFVSGDGDNVGEIGQFKLLDYEGAIIQMGHYISFFTKRDGRYVCIRDMANSVDFKSRN
jgi:ketosteroid isomerase-like protein